MKILNIIQCTNLGGMERSNLARLEALSDEGNPCHLVSLNSYGGLLPLLEQSSVSHEALDYSGRKVDTFLKLRCLVRSKMYDGIICTGHNLLTALALPRRHRSRHVLCIHFHHKGVKPSWFWKIYYRVALAKFAHIFFNSSFIRNEAIALVPKLAHSSSVLPNIYNVPEIISPSDRAEARTKLGLPHDSVIVSNAGWLIDRKRFDVFLKTAGLLRKKFPDICFVIAGDGPERRRLKELAEAEGLGDLVHWLGWQEDVEAVYAASNAVLFNTDWDAVARTPIEAGLLGINIVCSELNGGLHDLFDNPPWILQEHDPGRLAQLLSTYLDSPRAGEDQIEQIRHTILAKCSAGKHVEMLRLAFENG